MYRKTVLQLKGLLENKKISSVELMKAYLQRIKQVDEQIQAYITLQEEEILLQSAQEADQRRSQGKAGILEGIPMAVSDNICTQGMKTTGASFMLNSFVPPYQATVVEKYLEEGAILVGKLDMDEFGIHSPYSIAKVRNPWNLQMTLGSSGGGSSAAVAAEEIPFALGVDGGGDLRQPAHFCGCFALKPTYGRVSRYGLISVAPSFEQIGSVTKTVEDMDLLMGLLTGKDSKDPTTHSQPWVPLEKDLAISEMKIALPHFSDLFPCRPSIQKHIHKVASQLETLGARVEEVELPMLSYVPSMYQILTSAEASSNLARIDGIRYGHRAERYDDLSDLYQKTRQEGFGLGVKEKILFGTYVLSASHYETYYQKALKLRTLLYQEMNQIFQSYHMILTPVIPFPVWNREEKKSVQDYYWKDMYTAIANLTGFPALSIPTRDRIEGVPIGFQLIGQAGKEHQLLQVAYTYEQQEGISKRKEKSW